MKKLTYYTAAASAVLALTFTSSVYSQADSGSVPPLRGTPRILPLSMQERETPVTNNITNTTNQITQRVQPDTYQVAASGGGIGTSAAAVGCGADSLVGGGGSCYDGAGLVAVGSSIPYGGNGWYVGCQSLNGQPITATVYAVCSR